MSDDLLAAIKKAREAPLKPLTPFKAYVSKQMWEFYAKRFSKSIMATHFEIYPPFDSEE